MLEKWDKEFAKEDSFELLLSISLQEESADEIGLLLLLIIEVIAQQQSQEE